MKDPQLWSINESLLQSYRSIFISSQSFLLAVGAIVVDKSTAVLWPVAVAGLIVIWLVWRPAVVSRHRIVDYHKYGYLKDQDLTELSTEDEYVNCAKARKATNKALGIHTNWRSTRRKIDLYIPALFSLLWVVLITYGTWFA